MQNQLFDRIVAGEPLPLPQPDLIHFQGYCLAKCSSHDQPLDYLITISITLFKINKDYALQFLTYLADHEVKKPIYNNIQHQDAKITIYSNIFAMFLERSTREENKTERDKVMSQAKKYLNLSDMVRMGSDNSAINRIFLNYYTGLTTKALNGSREIQKKVDNQRKEIEKRRNQGNEDMGYMKVTHPEVTVLLMMAQVQFFRKNYATALKLYKNSLSIGKTLPAKARIGMAHCFFNLGKYQMARACFQRVVKLQPTCVEALVGIAVVYERQGDSSKYFEYLSLAYKINKRHPLVLLHLAQHFLFRKELQQSQKFSLLGLQFLERSVRFQKLEQTTPRNDYLQMKARFNNILGQVNHINGNYLQAIKYYNLAVGRKLYHNEISLAQCYIHPNTQNFVQAIRLLQDCYKNAEKSSQKNQLRLFNDSFKIMGYLKSKIPGRKDEKNADYYYTEAIKFNKYDFDSKIEYANVLVEGSKLKALKLLEEAEKIQLTFGQEVKPELLNNIAVFYLENDEIKACQQKLEKCLAVLENMKYGSEEEEVRVKGLELIVRFNYGICMERKGHWYTAKNIYEKILVSNRYYMDAVLRLAWVWYNLGSFGKMVETLQGLDKDGDSYRRVIRPERFITPKAYLLHIAGSSSQAKQTIKFLGKGKDIYSTILQLCINYEGLMRKGVQMGMLKQFLRPNRQFCYKFCKEDHSATFGYMLLAIICLVDKKLNKSQGMQFFNLLKQFSIEEIPSILFNMGLFLMNYEEYQSAIMVFQLYKDRTGLSYKVDELISLTYLLLDNFQKAEECMKRNILREPCNLKYRLQYSYLLQKKCQFYYQFGQEKRKIYQRRKVQRIIKEIQFCMRTLEFLAKVSISERIRYIQCPELKERVKNLYLKVKSCGEERKFYAGGYIKPFQNILSDLLKDEQRKRQQEKEAAALMRNQESQKGLLQLLEDAQESEDEEERQRKQMEKRRQRALEIAKKRQAEINSAWENLQAQEPLQDKKTKKRAPKQSSSLPGMAPRKRQKPKPKEQIYPEFNEEPDGLPEEQESFGEEEDLSEEEPQLEQDSERRHKKEKKEKKEKKKQKKEKKEKKKKKHKHKHHEENELDELRDELDIDEDEEESYEKEREKPEKKEVEEQIDDKYLV